jgi:hypothetical protein
MGVLAAVVLLLSGWNRERNFDFLDLCIGTFRRGSDGVNINHVGCHIENENWIIR